MDLKQTAPSRKPIVLRNCPFHRLTIEHPKLVCAMNTELLRTATEEFGGLGYGAVLEPADDLCCVQLSKAT